MHGDRLTRDKKLYEGAGVPMSIRTKLILSYAAMLVVPLAFILMISVLLVLVFQGNLQNAKDLYERTESVFDRDDIGHAANEIERTIDHNPAAIRDTAYLDEIGKELERSGAGLILKENRRIMYVSGNLNKKPALIAALPAYHADGFESPLPSVRIGNDYYIGTRLDFAQGHSSQYSVYIWASMDPLVYFARRYFPMLFTISLVILILTHAMLTYFMSRTIIRPLLQLKKAATRIKEGNLDFTVGMKGRDEIGQLGAAFEEMRNQLQKSIAVQQQYEANRKELISNISHDLKTPITAIRGYVDGLLEGVADTPEKSGKYIRTISAKAEEMDRLIDELFLYAKLDLNRVPFILEPVELAGYMADWSEELQFELEKRGISLETAIRLEAEASVLLDRDQFRRVLTNVVANSIKYMDKPDKLLSMSVEHENDRAVIVLHDNGAGISAEAVPHIFERFYRADSSRSSQTGGTGLGLAIAKQIMDGHGGSIEAISEKGSGTTIRIGLPILIEKERRKKNDQTHTAY